MRILVVDVGSSGVRAATIDEDGHVRHESRRLTPPDVPFPGLVEIDATALADAVLATAKEVLAADGPVDAVGIASQRASTIVWDRTTGEPVGPGLSWQDLRTVGECLTLQGEGMRLAPNQSATKLVNLLDSHDAERTRDLCFGTVDTWVAWTLSQGAVHVTDATNAGVTGLVTDDGHRWDEAALATLGVPHGVLPTIVDSTGVVGEATALPGAPPIAALVGDQQSSLIGQGCVRPGQAKITFGTGGMLDLVVGEDRPSFSHRGDAGCFPIVAWQQAGTIVYGVEAIMMAAGTNVDWLVEDLGLVDGPSDTAALAASVHDAEGVLYVPAPLGLGTPNWDFGARGALLGLTRGTTRAHIVRAVLEGVAQRGVDLIEAAEADGGHPLSTVRVDGGMSQNPVFVQALADAADRPVELSPGPERTTNGAGFLAGLAVGMWSDLGEIGDLWKPAAVVEPTGSFDRERWRDAVSRAARWHPDLSALEF
jgi:glycerol kinase